MTNKEGWKRVSKLYGEMAYTFAAMGHGYASHWALRKEMKAMRRSAKASEGHGAGGADADA